MAKNEQQGNLNFEISAHVVRQLGEELVTDEITAVMELIKNAYDADADWVKVSIHTDELDNRVEIQDNGFGMNYLDIKNGWLFISMSSKKSMKDELKVTPKGRAPLGEKGLGRLSTQKLGYQMQMITGKVDELIWHNISFNWEDFNENTELSTVKVDYSTSPKTEKEKGTTLIIRNLRNRTIWQKKELDRFRAELSQLIFPFKEKRPFNVYLSVDNSSLDLDEINENLRKAAIGKFSFSFDRNNFNIKGQIRLSKLVGNERERYIRLIQPDNGAHFFNFLSDSHNNKKYFIPNLEYTNGKEGWFVKFSIDLDWQTSFADKAMVYNEFEDKLEPANPGAFTGEIDEYNLKDGNDIQGAFERFSEYKELVKNQTGVRVFRDGFGLKPFGFNQNDWLQLNKGQTSGGSFYGLRPQNVIGYVLISTYENINLKEKTDREGFIDSPYSRNFFQLISKAVTEINRVCENIRRSYNDYQKKFAEEKGGIKSIKDSGNRLREATKIANKVDDKLQRLNEEFNQTSIKMKSEVVRIVNNPLFANESETTVLPILKEAESVLNRGAQLLKDINELLPLAKQLQSDADYLLPQIEGLEDQLTQFSELAGLGLLAEYLTHELYNILDRISGQTDQLVKKMKDFNNVDVAFLIYIEQVKGFTKNIRNQINHLAPSLKFNREQKQEIKVSYFVKDLKTYFENKFSVQGILFNINIKQDFIVRMNEGKLTQVFDNLLLNSEYWLRERQKIESGFNGLITIEVDDPLVRIYDNGFGVSKDVESSIFQPFVTTKPLSIGRGLGLFNAQQIIESHGGEIYLLPQRNSFDKRYIFQINFNSINK